MTTLLTHPAGLKRWVHDSEDGLTAAVARDPSWMTLDEHGHNEGKIFVVFRGGFWESSPEAVNVVDAGGIYVRPPGVRHSNHFGSAGLVALRISLGATRWQLLEGKIPPWADRVVDSPECFRAARSLVAPIIRGERDVCTERIGRLVSSIATACSRTPPPPDYLAALRTAVTREPARWGLGALAGRAQRNATRLAHAFRGHYGTSIGRYARRCRVYQASELLLRSTASLADIAATCGYCDQSHLTRTFRAERGVTPGVYRECATIVGDSPDLFVRFADDPKSLAPRPSSRRGRD